MEIKKKLFPFFFTLLIFFLKKVPVDKVAEKESIEVLESLLKSGEKEKVKVGLERVGDLCRMEQNRSVLGDAGLVELVCSAYKEYGGEDSEVVQWCARAFANFTFDHDENRRRIVKEEMLPLILHSIHSSQDHILLRNCAGCVANLSSQTPSIQEKVRELGGIETLLKLLEKGEHFENETLLCLTLRALTNLSDDPLNVVSMLNSKALQTLVQLFHEKQSESVFNELNTCLSSLVATPLACSLLLDLNFVEKTLQTATKLLSEKKEKGEGDKGGGENEERENEMWKSAFQVLVLLCEKETLRNLFPKKGKLEFLFQNLKNEDLEILIREQIAVCISRLSLDDECIQQLFPKVDFFIQNSQKKTSSTCLLPANSLEANAPPTAEEGVRIGCLMVVGNCARSDEHCKELMLKQNILHFLKPLIVENETSASTQIQHLSIGALLNLSLPIWNREEIVKEGLLKLLLQVVQQKERKNAHVLFGTVLTLKRLCSAEIHSEIRKKLVFEENAIPILLQIKEGLAMSEHERIWLEVGRLLCLLLRSDKEIFAQVLKEGAFMECATCLLQSNWVVLNAEAISAFHHISCSCDEKVVCELFDKQDFIELLLSKVSSPKDSTFALVCLSFLNSLLSFKTFQEKYSRNFKTWLEKMISQLQENLNPKDKEEHAKAIFHAKELLQHPSLQ